MPPLKNRPKANAFPPPPPPPCMSKRPQFFRVLIPTPFLKLHIPRNFMKHLDGEQYKKATLLSPLGKFWHIDLHKEGDDLYLDSGWSGFAVEHDLRTGYFVVFRYEGNMLFTVKVFDETCCLKEYELASCESPSCSTSTTSSESSESEVACLTLSQSSADNDEAQCNRTPSSKKRKSAEISREKKASPMTSPSKKSQNTSASSATPQNKKTKMTPPVASTIPTKKTKITPPITLTIPAKKNKITPPVASTIPTKKTKSASPSSAGSAIKNTKNRSCISAPFPQFEKIVRPLTSNYMSFPRQFCTRHGLLLKEVIILKNLKGKSYSVKLYDRRTEVRLGKGWKDFTLENGIRDGETCIFKLVTESTLLVCPKGKQGEIEEQQDYREETTPNCGGAIRHPQFEKIVRPFNIGLGYFTIPRSFCLENGLISKRNIILADSNGKKWPVRFLIRVDKAKFQKGWPKFSKAHDLQVGEKCIFTLVEENTFRVIVEKKQAQSAI